MSEMLKIFYIEGKIKEKMNKIVENKDDGKKVNYKMAGKWKKFHIEGKI